MTTVWDVAIGVCLLYLLLALIVTTLQELIASHLSLGAKHLYETLGALLAGNVAPADATQVAHPLLLAFYQHPLIRNLGKGLPSYIPSHTFALALLDVLRGTRSAADALGATALLANTRELASKVSDPDLERVLTLLLSDAEQLTSNLNERAQLVSQRLESWFNDRSTKNAKSYTFSRDCPEHYAALPSRRELRTLSPRRRRSQAGSAKSRVCS